MTLLRFVLLTTLVAAPVAAQVPVLPPVPAQTGVRLSGDIGSEGELYSMSGRDPRRPDESGRIVFNPTFALGAVTLSGNFLLSTEGSSLIGLGGLPGRQRINQFGLSPRWSWGKASVGSFSDTWSPLTWGGVRVDGVGFDLTPGPFRFGMFTGSSRQPVFGGATSGSFSRSMQGARIGAGRRSDYGTAERYLDLVVLRVRDDPSSLPPVADSMMVPFLPDSLASEPDTALLPHVPINPYSVTPHENAVAAVAAGLSVLGGAIAWTGEFAGSLHSRDRRASPLSDDELGDFPQVLRGLVTPRLGTHADVAHRNQIDVRISRLPGATASSPRSLTLSAGFQSIGAGYVSLATPYLPNDQRGVDGRAALRFRQWSLQLDGMRQHDNLLGQKLATTDRSRAGVVLTVQPVRGWHAGFRANAVGMVREIADSLGSVDYDARMLSTTQTWIAAAPGLVRSVSASYTWQSAGDDNPLRSATSLTSHTTDIRVQFPLGTAASFSPTLGVTNASVGGAPGDNRMTWGVAADWRDPGRRWTGTGSMHRSQVGRTMAVGSRLSVKVNVTALDALTLVLRTNQYRSLVDPDQDFNERALNLRWGRRF